MSVALSTIKKALKVDYITDDQELLRLRDAAISFISDYTGVSLTAKSKTQYISYWMRTRINTYPFISISTVKYYNTSNVETTMPATGYFLDLEQEPSVYINFSDYPQIKENTQIAITYTTGYSVLPAEIEQLVIGLVGAWYNNPEATAPITLSVVPLSAMFILDNMRIKGVLT
jgi:hypothetical protein